MSITSMTFVFLFLPISLICYHIGGKRVKEPILLILSLVFYAAGSRDYVILFALAVLLTVLIGRIIHRLPDASTLRKVLLICGILLNVLPLAYYKYTGFFLSTIGSLTSRDITIRDIALPLGISFFTFKSISYLVDVYKKKADLSTNPVHDAVYLSFFAQIQSGPLSRYNDMAQENPGRFDFNLFSEGACRFLIGFSKKILLADVLSKITSEIFAAPFDSFSTPYAWLGSVCYSLELFFDFSGYSDMAIGISEMFGYTCPENFNYPYMTDSVSKFWRRWHITLSQWFRDYIYIPLGGSRTGNKWRVYVNLLIVWTLTGIWHGATWSFVAWGLSYFVMISLERALNLPGRFRTKAGRILYRIFSLLFINFQWVLFRSGSLASGLAYIKRMIVPCHNAVANARTLFLLSDYGIFITAAILFSTPIVPFLGAKLEENRTAHLAFRALFYLLVIGAFLWAVSLVVAGQNNPFAYANF